MSIIPTFILNRISHRPNLVKIVDNLGWLFLDKLLRMGVGLLVGVWIARYLGPEQFGLLNFAQAFTGLFGAIAALGMQGIVVRDLVRTPESAQLTLGTAAALQLFGGLVSFLLILGTITLLRPNDDLAKGIVSLLGAAMLFKASDIAVYWFESKVQSRYTVLVQNVVFLIFGIVKIVLILQNSTIEVFAWFMLAEAALVAVCLLLVMEVRGLPIRSLTMSKERARTLLKDCWPLILSGLSITLYMKIDQIMLGQMIGDEEVGIFSAAVRVSEIWYFIPMAIVASVFPAILEAQKHSKKKYDAQLQKLYDLMIVISLAVAIPMTFLSSTLTRLLFGEAYTAAGTVLAIHIWASVFVFLGVASSRWFLVENRQWLSLQRTVVGAITNVVLNLLLIPEFGAIGAAVSLVISQAIASWLYDYVHLVTRPMFFMKLSSMHPIAVFLRFTKNNNE